MGKVGIALQTSIVLSAAVAESLSTDGAVKHSAAKALSNICSFGGNNRELDAKYLNCANGEVLGKCNEFDVSGFGCDQLAYFIAAASTAFCCPMPHRLATAKCQRHSN